LLESEGALLTVPDEEALAEAVLELLNSDARRQAMGEAARALIASNQQALPEHLRLIRSLLA
jgi:3-deoxy-D-manno-octulosonic-acid transferase